MKKLLFVAAAALFFTGTTFAGTDKGKKKKCGKGTSCCSHKKECSKDKAKPAEL